MKALSSWQYSSQYLSQPMLSVCACERLCVCVKVLCSVRHQRCMACAPALVEGYIFMLRESVREHLCIQPAKCVRPWVIPSECLKTSVCVFFFFLYISLFPAHFFFTLLRGCERCAKTGFLTHAPVVSSSWQVWADLFCVRARVRALAPAACHYDEQWQLWPLHPTALLSASIWLLRVTKEPGLSPRHIYHTGLNRPAMSVKCNSLKCNFFFKH